jgi:hypothetical protein
VQTAAKAKMSKRNLKYLTLKDKLKLIAEVEKGEKKRKILQKNLEYRLILYQPF